MRLIGSLDWGNWIYGLVAGFIGGGSTAVSGGLALLVIDPNDFNFSNPKLFKAMAAMFLFSGVKDMMLYLHQQPLPKIITTTTVTETSVSPGLPPGIPAVTTTKKVEQTKVEPVKPEEP